MTLNIFARHYQTTRLKEIAFHPSDTSLFLQIPISSCVQQMEQVQKFTFHTERDTDKYKVLSLSRRKKQVRAGGGDGGGAKYMVENRLRHAHFNSLNIYLLCHLLHSRSCSRYWGCNTKQSRQYPCPYGFMCK